MRGPPGARWAHPAPERERTPAVWPGSSPTCRSLHAEAATAVVVAAGGRLLLLRLVDHQGLGGEQQGRDRGGVLHRRPGHLGRVDDAGLEQVGVLAGGGVEALGVAQVAHPRDHHGALVAGVLGDPVGRQLERPAHDLGAGRLVADQVQLVQRGLGAQQGDPAAGHDALLDGRTGGRDGVLDAVLLLLQLDLGGRRVVDNTNAAGQLGEPLLQLLAVPVGVGVLDLLLDLADAALDVRVRAAALDDGGVVLGHADPARPAEQVEPDVVELEADLLADQLAAGEGGDVTQHRLAAVAEAWGLDRDALEGAADLVDHQGGKGLALDVLGDDQERAAGLHDLLEHRQQRLHRGDLLVGDQDVGVLHHRLHAVLVGDEVGRDVALVELHALGELELDAKGVRLVDGDDPVLADLVHRLGDGLADLGVLGGDGGHRGHLLLALDVAGLVADVLGDRLDGALDAALEAHRVGAGGDVAQPLVDQGLGQLGGGGGAVTGDVVGLGRDLLGELGAEVLVVVLELDLLGDGDAVVGDRGGAPLLVEHHVAALGAEGDADHVGEMVDARLQLAPGVGAEHELLGHVIPSSLKRAGSGRSDLNLLSDRAGPEPDFGYLVTIASTSRAERIRYSSPPTLTSVPPYLE